MRNRIPLLFAASAVVLVAALFWPEPKKSGELQKYYTRDIRQFISLRYKGEMNIGDKNKVHAEYEVIREENPFKPKEPVYRVQIYELTSREKFFEGRTAALKAAKTFYASALVRTIIQDWSALDFYFVLPHEAAKDQEYGLANCINLLQIKFKADKREFCIGSPTQGDTRRYVLDRSQDRLLITPDYTVRRVLNNIFAQRETLLHPYGTDAFDLIELNIAPAMLRKLPLLSEKTGGRMRLRMLVKKDGPAPVNVWHVENLLSIKPSHAAEFAQLLTGMRVQAVFAQSVLSGDATLKDLSSALGIAEATQPMVSGSLLLKQTDQQDKLLTRYAFFAPGTRPAGKREFQSENQLIRPLDSLAATAFNAGYITADLFPRFSALFQKFENDLQEAVQAGKRESSGGKATAKSK